MRHTAMLRLFAPALLLGFAGALSLSAAAQSSVGHGLATQVKDSSMLHPPPGQKIAIVEWEDLECPACSAAFPTVHSAAAHYHIPIVRYDFQIQGHIWSHEGSLYARYLQDKVNPELATEYRREVFASQYRISSKDDLQRFTTKFFADHHQQMPFVLDPQLAREVDADRDLGIRMGLNHTPTIFVVTAHHWIDVTDVSDLYSAIDQAEAEAGQASSAPARKPASAHR